MGFVNDNMRDVNPWHLLRVQVNGYNQAIKTQDFSKNKNKNHSYKQTRLLGCATNTSIPNNSYSKTSCKTWKSYSKPSTKMNETTEENIELDHISIY